MLRTAANETWMFFFEHPMFDRRKGEVRFAPDFDWKNASYMYLVQGQASAPFGLDKLKQLVASGRLKPLDHVCIDPGHKWAKVCQLPFFNRRGKKVGMYLPSIPDEEVFSEATRIAIGRIQREDHPDATLGEILSANEKAKNHITSITSQILGKKKSTIALRMVSLMALIIIVTAVFTPGHKKARPSVPAKASAPMAQVIGKAQNIRPAAAKTTAKAPKTTTFKKNKNNTRTVASAKTPPRPTSFKHKTPAPLRPKDPLKAKVTPVDPPTMVYGKSTRKPKVLSPAERRNLDYDGTSFNPDEGMPVYDEENHRGPSSEDDDNLSSDDEEISDGEEGDSFQEKAFINKMRKAFQERHKKKSSSFDGEDY
jgi:hypothetical protein